MSLEQALETLAASITRLAAAVDGAKAVPQAAVEAVKVVHVEAATQPAEPVAQPAATTGEVTKEMISGRINEALRAKKGAQAAEILRDVGGGAVKASAVPENLRKSVFDALGRLLTGE